MINLLKVIRCTSPSSSDIWRDVVCGLHLSNVFVSTPGYFMISFQGSILNIYDVFLSIRLIEMTNVVLRIIRKLWITFLLSSVLYDVIYVVDNQVIILIDYCSSSTMFLKPLVHYIITEGVAWDVNLVFRYCRQSASIIQCRRHNEILYCYSKMALKT